MPRTVILEHTTPDAQKHFDWMIAPDDADRGPDKRDLLHFRVPDRPDALALEAVMAARRGPPHRRRYLTFEGDLEGDRGSVRRVGEGTATVDASMPGRLLITARFAEQTVVIEARSDADDPDQWVLQRTR